MEVVQETSRYAHVTSPDQEYEEIQLKQRKLDIEHQEESQQGSQVELTSKTRNIRTKKSQLYSSVESRKKVETSGISDGAAYTVRLSSKCVVVLAMVAILVAILALVLSLLAVIIVMTANPNTSRDCKDISRSTTKSVQDSKGNVTALQELLLDVTEQKLQDFEQIFLDRLTSVNATLTNQISTVSKMQGPRGPAGYNGSQGLNGSQGPAGSPGPKGAGNFSQCQYKIKYSSGISSGVGAKNDVTVVEPSDKRVVGATCSTDDAKEYRLSSGIYTSGSNAGKRFYKCKCAGQADIMKDGGGKMKCILHYWECPKP